MKGESTLQFLMPKRSWFSRRVFVREDDGTIRRISAARYERLRQRDPDTAFPEYAGRSVRFAVSDVEILDGRPIEIMAIDCLLVHLDENGAMDPRRAAEEERLSDQIMRAFERGTKRRPFAGLQHPACERMSAEFRWTLSDEDEAAISRLALTPRG